MVSWTVSMRYVLALLSDGQERTISEMATASVPAYIVNDVLDELIAQDKVVRSEAGRYFSVTDEAENARVQRWHEMAVSYAKGETPWQDLPHREPMFPYEV